MTGDKTTLPNVHLITNQPKYSKMACHYQNDYHMNNYENMKSILDSYKTDNAKPNKSIILKMHANYMQM